MNQVAAINEMTNQAIIGLAHFIHEALDRRLEAIRLARAGWALLVSGCSPNAPFPGHTLASYLTDTQRENGGWADVEETLWCLGYLSFYADNYSTQLGLGKHWLASVRKPCGAWGKTERDQSRIPVTGLISAVCPEVVEPEALDWLADEWQHDLDSSAHLTYKEASFLLGQLHPEALHENDLVEHTITLLCGEQEDNGGFSPWKAHPVGSDTWSTGIALWGLAGFASRVPAQTLQRGMSWLQSRQLSNGMWPYHYLDEGTVMALIWAASAIHYTKGQ